MKYTQRSSRPNKRRFNIIITLPFKACWLLCAPPGLTIKAVHSVHVGYTCVLGFSGGNLKERGHLEDLR